MCTPRLLSFCALTLLVCACAYADGHADDEIRAIVAEMMADARERSSLLDPAVVIEHRGGFFLTADTGDAIRVGGIAQLRYFRTFGGDEEEGGFQTRRTRLDFRGTVADAGVTYRVRWDFSRSTGRSGLLDAFAEHGFAPGWSVRAGQFTVPFDREFFTAPTNLQLIDRSIVSSVFRVNRSQGVMLAYRGDRERFYFTLDDGRVGLNTDFLGANEADIGLTARAELRLGDAPWSQYATHSGRPGDATGAMLGAGVHYQHNGNTGAPADAGEEVDLLLYTADASAEGDGWSAIATLAGRATTGDEELHEFGAMVQGGLFVTDGVELYARYAHVFGDDDRGGASDDFDALTLGANWYPLAGSRALRLSAEATWYPTAQGESADLLRAPDTTLALTPDGTVGQWALTFQAQIVF